MLIHDPRATKTELRKGAVKSEIERDPRNSRNVCGRRGDGRTEMGKNWTKGKGKNSQRKYGKQHRTGNGENITEIQNYPEEVHERRERTRDGTNLRRVCWENEDEKNRTQERGKETEWKHIENKSGKPWRNSTEAWK